MSPYTWIRTRDQLPVLAADAHVKVYYAEGRRKTDLALGRLGAPYSGIIMRAKVPNANLSNPYHMKRQMVFQFVPKHGFLAALVPGVNAEGLPTWRNQGIVAYKNSIIKEEWVKETYIASMTG